MKNVVVTGANGFVGSALINRLINDGTTVVAIDTMFTNKHLPQSDLLIKISETIEAIEKLSAKIPHIHFDAFYHLAWCGVNGAEKANPSIQINNIQLTIKAVELAKKLNCCKFLCSGTIAERAVESLPYLERTSGGMTYGVAKYCTHMMLETLCKNVNLNFIWMQFSNIYGPDNKTGNIVSYTLNELMNGRNALFGPAEQPFDFIYIDDLIEAIVRLGERNTASNSYFIGSGESKPLKEFLLEIGSIMNQQKRIRIGERPDDGIRYNCEMFDISPLVNEIGVYVTKTFQEGIRKTINDYQQNL